eukprot:9486219-Pyramimonas_sp.AAC.2
MRSDRGVEAYTHVTDSKDGTFLVNYNIPFPGRWDAVVSVDGQPLEDERFSFLAKYGKLLALEIQLEGGGLGEALCPCGEAVPLAIRAVAFGNVRRSMRGDELVAVTVTAPSGVKQSVDVQVRRCPVERECIFRFAAASAARGCSGLRCLGSLTEAGAGGARVLPREPALLGDGCAPRGRAARGGVRHLLAVQCAGGAAG